MTALERAQAIEEAAREILERNGVEHHGCGAACSYQRLRAALALEVENYEQSQRRIFGWKGEKP